MVPHQSLAEVLQKFTSGADAKESGAGAIASLPSARLKCGIMCSQGLAFPNKAGEFGRGGAHRCSELWLDVTRMHPMLPRLAAQNHPSARPRLRRTAPQAAPLLRHTDLRHTHAKKAANISKESKNKRDLGHLSADHSPPHWLTR